MHSLDGIHHISAVTASATQNLEFYSGVLGLRLVKKTVNQDDPTVYHLFYADEAGSPGADLTFFEYPGAPRGRAGAGMIHRIAMRVGSRDALDFWAQRLAAAGVGSEREGERLRFEDPEGLGLELTAEPSTDRPLVAAHSEIPERFALSGFAGVRAFSRRSEASREFLLQTLGFATEGGHSYSARGDSRGSFYLYDGANGIEEVDSGGNLLARYTQEPRWDGPLSMLRGSVTSYYEQDGLNSVASLTNSSGALAQSYTYDSYGKITASTGTVPNENSVRPMADVIPPNEPRSSSGLRLCLSLVNGIRGGTRGQGSAIRTTVSKWPPRQNLWVDFTFRSLWGIIGVDPYSFEIQGVAGRNNNVTRRLSDLEQVSSSRGCVKSGETRSVFQGGARRRLFHSPQTVLQSHQKEPSNAKEVRFSPS